MNRITCNYNVLVPEITTVLSKDTGNVNDTLVFFLKNHYTGKRSQNREK